MVPIRNPKLAGHQEQEDGEKLPPRPAQGGRQPNEPEGLGILRNSWTEAKEKGSEKLKAPYLRDLEKLRTSYTKQERFGDAVLVRDEIDRINQGAARPGGHGNKGPAELDARRAKFEREMRDKNEELDGIYLDALTERRTWYAKKDNLAGALAVEAEIKKVFPAEGQAGQVDRIPIPEEAIAHRGHHYLLIKKKMKWNAAKRHCEGLGGHLVTITSSPEQTFVKRILSESGASEGWIGLSDHEEEGTWVWITGEPFKYRTWNKNEPNSWKGDEDFVAMRMAAGGKWIDASSDYEIVFVCEWDW